MAGHTGDYGSLDVSGCDRGQGALGGEHGIDKKADCAIFQQDRSITNLGQFQTASPLMKIWPPENAFSGGQIDL